MKLHQPHQPNHAQSSQRDERIYGNAVEHRGKSCFFEVGDVCSKTDRRQCRHHQEFTCCFHHARNRCGDPTDAVDNGERQKSANACSCGDQITELPIQLEDLAHEIAAAKAHEEGKYHHKEGHFANRHNRADRKGSTQKNDGDLQNLFGYKFESGLDPRGVKKTVDDGSHKERDDGCAEESTGNEMLQENRNSRNACANGNAKSEETALLCFYIHKNLQGCRFCRKVL